MIHPSENWRFIEPLEDRGYFEDEVVSHLVTEHRALRRSFSEKVCQDEDVLAEIVEQAHLAARCTPPVLPWIYALEKVEGRLTMIMEVVEGKSLALMIHERLFSKQIPWLRMAIRITEAMTELEEESARFDRIAAEHIVVTKAGTLRIPQRWPIGIPAPARMERSPLLQRMARQPHGGIYVAKRRNLAQEMEAILAIFAKMYYGEHTTLEQLPGKLQQATVTGRPERTTVSEILRGIYTGPEGNGSINNLGALIERLRSGLDDENRRYQEELRQARTIPPKSPETRPSSLYSIDSPTGQSPAVASQMPSSYASSSGIAPPGEREDFPSANPYIRGAHTSNEDINPYASTDSKPKTPSKSSILSRKSRSTPVPASSEDDMVNPYAGGLSSDAAAIGDSDSPTPLPRPASRKGPSVLSRIPFGLLAVALVILLAVAGAVVLLNMFAGGRATERPVAVIAPLERDSYPVNVPFTLSGAPSYDPDGGELSYEWQIVSPDNATVIFTDPATGSTSERHRFSTRTPEIRVQFLSAGDKTIQLVVFDGTFYSQPDTVTVNIPPVTR